MEYNQIKFLRFEISFEPEDSDLFFLWFNNYIIEYQPPLKFKLSKDGSYNIYLLGGEFGGEDRIIANIQFLKSEDKKYTVKAFQIATPGHVRKQEHIRLGSPIYKDFLSSIIPKDDQVIVMKVPYFVKDFIFELKNLWGVNVPEEILSELSKEKTKEIASSEVIDKQAMPPDALLLNENKTKATKLLTSKEALQLQQILEYRARNPNITHKELAQLLNVSEKTIQRRLQALAEQEG